MNTNTEAVDAGGALRLEDWGLILAEGADAASFLHGQLTQDIQGLVPGQARLAGYCSPKGRLLASFVALRLDADTIALACSADVLAATLKRLRMFVLRAKCTLSDASAQRPLWGLAGQAAGRWLGAAAIAAPAWRSGHDAATAGGASAVWIRLPDVAGVPRWLWLASAGETPPLPTLDRSRWEALEVASGVPRVTAATADHFVPQMVNLELVGGVNFQKGCYPGQEIVARSQYRGTLKRRMFLARGLQPLVAGQEIIHTADPGQPAGEVVLVAPDDNGGWLAQVEIKSALRAADGEFRAHDAQLRLTEPPYPIPSEAA